MSAVESAVRWCGLCDVMRRLSVGRRAALKLIDSGQIGVLSLPGLPDRYNLDDVERLLDEGMRPAKTRGADRELAMT